MFGSFIEESYISPKYVNIVLYRVYQPSLCSHISQMGPCSHIDLVESTSHWDLSPWGKVPLADLHDMADIFLCVWTMSCIVIPKTMLLLLHVAIKSQRSLQKSNLMSIKLLKIYHITNLFNISQQTGEIYHVWRILKTLSYLF